MIHGGDHVELCAEPNLRAVDTIEPRRDPSEARRRQSNRTLTSAEDWGHGISPNARNHSFVGEAIARPPCRWSNCFSGRYGEMADVRMAIGPDGLEVLLGGKPLEAPDGEIKTRSGENHKRHHRRSDAQRSILRSGLDGARSLIEGS